MLARFVRNHRLADALHQQAFCALNASPGAPTRQSGPDLTHEQETMIKMPSL